VLAGLVTVKIFSSPYKTKLVISSEITDYLNSVEPLDYLKPESWNRFFQKMGPLESCWISERDKLNLKLKNAQRGCKYQ
jgi:hypothetical protein